MTAIDEQKIDCHCHVLDPGKHPYRDDVKYRPAGQEIGTAVQFNAICEAYRVEHALLVGPNSGYGEDNSCLLDVIAGSGGRFKGIAVVPNDASEDYLANLKRQGVVGIAFNATYHGVDYYRDAQPLIRRVAAPACSFRSGRRRSDRLAHSTHQEPRCKVVDHCGRPTLELGLLQPA